MGRGIGIADVAVAAMLAAMVAVGLAPRYLAERERATLAQAADNMRATVQAIESYYIDHQVYPASGCAVGEERRYESHLFWQPRRESSVVGGVGTINSFARETSGAARLVTFRIAGSIAPGRIVNLHTLTTPVAYLRKFYEDPFARTAGASFGYFSHGSRLGWILFGLGPDRDENATGGPGDVSARVEHLYALSEDFPGMWVPPPELTDRRYDPTNGLLSNGDLFLTGGS